MSNGAGLGMHDARTCGQSARGRRTKCRQAGPRPSVPCWQNEARRGEHVRGTWTCASLGIGVPPLPRRWFPHRRPRRQSYRARRTVVHISADKMPRLQCQKTPGHSQPRLPVSSRAKYFVGRFIATPITILSGLAGGISCSKCVMAFACTPFSSATENCPLRRLILLLKQGRLQAIFAIFSELR
jgi:hypothetical protein